MFERFAKSARNVVAAAEDEARALGSRSVEAEHLLLALAGAQSAAPGSAPGSGRGAAEGDAPAGAKGAAPGDAEGAAVSGALGDAAGAAVSGVLAAAGLDRDGVLDALETERERSLMAVGVSARDFELPAAPRTGGRLRWGASAKLALERSLRAALDRGDRRIEPGHILLGLLRAEAGTVPRALAAAGIDRDELADAVAHELARAR
jgi:hypothetical protein